MTTLWSKEEINYLKNEYDKGTNCLLISQTLNRSYHSVRSKAYDLGFTNSSKPLLKLNVDFVKNKIKNENYTITELSKELDISKSALLAYCKRNKYNYKSDYNFFHINKFKRNIKQGESGFNSLLKNYKESSEKRGYIFNLSSEQFRFLTKQNCHYCGIIPNQIRKNNAKDSWGSYTYNGIDRKDNTKGYTLENCVPCCGQCNVIKMDLSYSEFLNKIELIYKRLMENK